MQHYYVALGGGCGGAVYGSGWMCDTVEYDTYRDHGGRTQTIHFTRLFTSRNWTTLTPDYDHKFITSGYGTLSPTTMDYVGAAINEGSLGIAYCQGATTLTVDMSRFSGPIRTRWYDPTSGAFQRAEARLPNRGSRSLSTPGKNHAGVGDWVLVLETA